MPCLRMYGSRILSLKARHETAAGWFFRGIISLIYFHFLILGRVGVSLDIILHMYLFLNIAAGWFFSEYNRTHMFLSSYTVWPARWAWASGRRS